MNTQISPLVLEAARATMLKISPNVLHKDPNLTIFTLPVEGIHLVEQQLDAFLGKYTYRSWYEQRGDGSWHPCSWWNHRKDADFPIDEEFHTDALTLGLSGDEQLEFETEEPEEEGDDRVPAAKISSESRRGARKDIERFRARAERGVIDGRSERVKHQDGDQADTSPEAA